MHLKQDVWLLLHNTNVIMGDIDTLINAITIVSSANATNKGRRRRGKLVPISPLTCQVTAKWFQTQMC